MDYYTVLNPTAAQSTINQMSLWFVSPTHFSLHMAILMGGLKKRNTVMADSVKDVQRWSHIYNVSN